ERKRLNVPGEKDYVGKGVSYCADCDGVLFAAQPVAVVGDGSAAASTCLTMLLLASEVHWVHGETDLSPGLYEKVAQSLVVDHPGRWPARIVGDGEVTGLELDDGAVLAVAGIFIELGARGITRIAAELGVALGGETGRFVSTDKKQHTSVGGVFAAGDICGQPWQVAKSVGEGAVAGIEAAASARSAKKGT
ncbi:MAG: FAD-dependent oxidoreductase, partial [Deltaproteobacteria bacterium]|nr:FAD-dependent oxidoreductase [Deltaproteobacteria bacterium]